MTHLSCASQHDVCQQAHVEQPAHRAQRLDRPLQGKPRLLRRCVRNALVQLQRVQVAPVNYNHGTYANESQVAPVNYNHGIYAAQCASRWFNYTESRSRLFNCNHGIYAAQCASRWFNGQRVQVAPGQQQRERNALVQQQRVRNAQVQLQPRHLRQVRIAHGQQGQSRLLRHGLTRVGLTC